MKALQTLPEGYREIYSIDLQRDRKAAVSVNLAALVITAVMAVPVHFIIPVSSLFAREGSLTEYLIRIAIFIAGLVVYMVLHELVHGIAMKHYGAKKVRYGFTGMYAFAACDEFFYRKPYIVIALAPIVVWGIVLAVINVFVPRDYFWLVYIIQICNISGAAGDLYVSAKFSRLPKDILVRDSGVGMTVYSAE